jgi:hypothetical protein
MVVGQQLKKWTYLLDNVEVKGIVLNGNETLVEKDLDPNTGNIIQHPKGEAIGASDFFNLVPDENYNNLLVNSPGSMGVIHCECYCCKDAVWSGIVDDPNRINRTNPSWSLGNKPDTPLTLTNRPNDHLLRVGDHIRITGQWVIENGHPTNPGHRKLGTDYETGQKKYVLDPIMRGELAYGFVFMELHPFHWNSIEWLDAPQPNNIVTETISVAGPVYECVYIDNWVANKIAGVTNKVFIESDGTYFHNGSSARSYIMAMPARPGYDPCKKYSDQIALLQQENNEAQAELNAKPPPTGQERAAIAQGIKNRNKQINDLTITFQNCQPISFTENVLINSSGLPLEQIRWITKVQDGIQVTVSLPATPTLTFNGLKLADINNPANNQSVFQAIYQVQWTPS